MLFLKNLQQEKKKEPVSFLRFDVCHCWALNIYVYGTRGYRTRKNLTYVWNRAFSFDEHAPEKKIILLDLRPL